MTIYRYLNKILPIINNPTVFEIGAHIGTDTVKLLDLLQFPYTYIAFEPDLRNSRRLYRLRKDKGLDFLLSYKAVGNVNGKIRFYLSDGKGPTSIRNHTDSSSLKQPKDNVKLRPWLKFTETEVWCVRLDSFCQQWRIDKIDFIWADIQGAELEMIEGGQETLKRTRYLYTECQEGRYHGQPGFKKIMEALPGKWEVIYRTPAEVLLKNDKY